MAKKKISLPEGDSEAHSRRLAKSATPLGVVPLRVKCKNPTQKKLLKSAQENEITIVSGLPGTGKSYITIYAALDWLKTHPEECEKILFIVPVECDSYEEIGFLSGDADQKTKPWADECLYTVEKILRDSGQKPDDAKKIVKEMLAKGIIQFAPTTFLRGCNFDNCVVIVSESQNYVEKSMLKILTRIGTNCKLFLTGDLMQISSKTLVKGKAESGLKVAIEKLNDLEGVGIIEFNNASEIVRNKLISKILYRWNPEAYSYLKDAPGIEEGIKE